VANILYRHVLFICVCWLRCWTFKRLSRISLGSQQFYLPRPSFNSTTVRVDSFVLQRSLEHPGKISHASVMRDAREADGSDKTSCSRTNATRVLHVYTWYFKMCKRSIFNVVSRVVCRVAQSYGTNPSRTTIDAVEKAASSSSTMSSSFFYSIWITFGIQEITGEEL
jgi:hypothetical protein